MTSKRSLLLFFCLYFLLTLSVHAKDQSEALLELFQRIDNLGSELRTLRGENEQLQHNIDKLKKAQKDGFLGIDERMDGLAKQINVIAKKQPTSPTTIAVKKPENKAPAKPIPPKENIKIKSVATDSKKPITNPPQVATEKMKAKPTDNTKIEKVAKHKTRTATQKEKSAYNQAYATINGNPSNAIEAFRSYIIKYPNSPLAANAQYWIGEILYSQKNYKKAIDEFIKVLQNYKNSEKASDASIKLGFSFYELRNWVYARRALEDVSRYFPNTRAASLARQRIAKMKAEGKY